MSFDQTLDLAAVVHFIIICDLNILGTLPPPPPPAPLSRYYTNAQPNIKIRQK